MQGPDTLSFGEDLARMRVLRVLRRVPLGLLLWLFESSCWCIDRRGRTERQVAFPLSFHGSTQHGPAFVMPPLKPLNFVMLSSQILSLR